MKFLKSIYKCLQYNINIKKFLDKPISFTECQKYIKKGIENREDNFLIYIKNLIYNQKKSPYLELLKLSNITFDDVKKMIDQEGVEGALRIIKDEGVYITFDEFKCRKEVKRKGKTFRFRQNDFLNPFQDSLGIVFSGASRGSGTQISWGLGYLMQKIAHEAIILNLHGCYNNPIALWYPILPAQTALYPMRLRKLGIPPQVWFSQVEKKSLELPEDKLIAFLDYTCKKLFALSDISSRYVSLKNAHVIAEWLANNLNEYPTCSIHTYLSSAVRICLAAKERGLDIKNTKFVVSGEPLTERRRKEIEDLGCEIINTYYFTEGGLAGCSCNKPSEKIGSIHFFRDSFALIQHPRLIEDSSQEVNAFLFTSLYSDCPIVMLNMENGDYGVIEKSDCGCVFEEYGFVDCISNISSHEKIKTEGLTFYINDMINIVEDVLPEKFGGSSIDYQLVQQEDEHGLTHLLFYVDKKIKLLDREKMKKLIFEKLSDNVRKDIRINIFNQIKALEILRESPLVTPRGKTPFFYKSK